MIVVDASAAVAVLLNLDPEAQRIRERMADEELHVPHLFEVEVLSALRCYSLRGDLSEKRSAELLEDLTTMRIIRYPHTVLLFRVWELRDNATAYDAAYIALAETLEAPLVTTDARLARVPGIHAEVEAFE